MFIGLNYIPNFYWIDSIDRRLFFKIHVKCYIMNAIHLHNPPHLSLVATCNESLSAIIICIVVGHKTAVYCT